MIRLEFFICFLLTCSCTVYTLRCYQCSFVNSPSSCSHLVACSQDEQCFTERRYDGSMREYYTMGCVSSSFCQNIDNEFIIGKRSISANISNVSERYKRDNGCLQCCLSENCNKDLCVKPALNTSASEVRLINGNNSYQGTVEVFYNNRWGTVCDDGWSTNAAKVVCRWLGFHSDMATAVTENGFHSNHSNAFLLDGVVCTGNESNLKECTHEPWDYSDCRAGEDAGVICPEALFPNHDVLFLLEKKLYKIIRVDLHLKTYSFIKINSTYCPDSFDYDPDNDELYFYDDHLKRILRMKSDGTDLRLVLQLEYNSDVYSVKVDPKNGFVFYSDDGVSALRSAALSGQILTSITSYSPRAIALNPISRFVYWSDWGVQPMIEAAYYDGSNRRTLISSGLKWPSALSIDFQENRLYFVDGGTGNIESIDLASNTRRTILQESAHLLSLDVIGNDIYYTAINRSTPYRIHKDGSNRTAIGFEDFSDLTEVIVYKHGTNSLGQTISQVFNTSTHSVFFRIMKTGDMTSGPVEIFINGEWRSVCSLNWDDAAAKVACHMLGFDRYRAIKSEYQLEGVLYMSTLKCTGDENNIVECQFHPQNWHLHYCSSDRKAGVMCEHSMHSLDYRLDDFLIFCNASTDTLIRMDLNSYSYTASSISFRNGSLPVAVTFDTYNQNYYVSKVNYVNRNSTIVVLDNRGNFNRYLAYIPTGSIINGLALDTRRNTLYYVDGGNSVVGSMSTYGTDQKILATNVYQPGGIALDKRHLVIYWTEGGATPKVVKINHDSTNKQVIASSGLNDPRGIAVDPAANLVYFCNSGQSTIEVMEMDGRNRRVIFTDHLSQLQGLTITSKYIFYTDLNRRKIMRLNRDGTNSTSVGTGDFPGVYDIDAYDSTLS